MFLGDAAALGGGEETVEEAGRPERPRKNWKYRSKILFLRVQIPLRNGEKADARRVRAPTRGRGESLIVGRGEPMKVETHTQLYYEEV